MRKEDKLPRGSGPAPFEKPSFSFTRDGNDVHITIETHDSGNRVEKTRYSFVFRKNKDGKWMMKNYENERTQFLRNLDTGEYGGAKTVPWMPQPEDFSLMEETISEAIHDVENDLNKRRQ